MNDCNVQLHVRQSNIFFVKIFALLAHRFDSNFIILRKKDSSALRIIRFVGNFFPLTVKYNNKIKMLRLEGIILRLKNVLKL